MSIKKAIKIGDYIFFVLGVTGSSSWGSNNITRHYGLLRQLYKNTGGNTRGEGKKKEPSKKYRQTPGDLGKIIDLRSIGCCDHQVCDTKSGEIKQQRQQKFLCGQKFSIIAVNDRNSIISKKTGQGFEGLQD